MRNADRLRLAHELHDTVSHAVTGMMLQAAGSQALLQPTDERLRHALSVIESTGIQAMSELHRLLGLLDPAGPDSVSAAEQSAPTLADIVKLVGMAQAAGRDVRMLEDGTAGRLDPSVQVAAYRVVQESLTNSSKHAGPDSAVTVALHWSEDQLEVRVKDQRRGPALDADREAALSSGRGLRGLSERIALIGGTLVSGPIPNGFEVVARLPRPGVSAVLRAVEGAIS